MEILYNKPAVFLSIVSIFIQSIPLVLKKIASDYKMNYKSYYALKTAGDRV